MAKFRQRIPAECFFIENRTTQDESTNEQLRYRISFDLDSRLDERFPEKGNREIPVQVKRLCFRTNPSVLWLYLLGLW